MDAQGKGHGHFVLAWGVTAYGRELHVHFQATANVGGEDCISTDCTLCPGCPVNLLPWVKSLTVMVVATNNRDVSTHNPSFILGANCFDIPGAKMFIFNATTLEHGLYCPELGKAREVQKVGALAFVRRQLWH